MLCSSSGGSSGSGGSSRWHAAPYWHWWLSLLLLASAAVAAGAAAADSGGSAVQPQPARYGVHDVVIADSTGTLHIQARMYLPHEPLTQPPGLVVMAPALGQHATAGGLLPYAHVFASNGLAVLSLSSPGLGGAASERGTLQLLRLHRFRRAVSRHVETLGQQGVVDAHRLAYWGAEWGAALVAAPAAVQAPEGAVRAIILQTPWLHSPRAWAWRQLRARGWLHTLQAILAAAVDWLAASLRLPVHMSITVPLAGLPGSAALLELSEQELVLHKEALHANSSIEQPAGTPGLPDRKAAVVGARIRAAALLELLWHGNAIASLLPSIDAPLGFYAAAGDSDTPGADYMRASKAARYVSFHMAPGSRYGLLRHARDQSEAQHEAVVDQAMLLVALLGEHDFGDIPQAGGEAAGDQEEEGEDGDGAAGADVIEPAKLLPFQREGGFHGLGQQCSQQLR